MFEKKTEDLLTKKGFLLRQARFSIYAMGLLAFSLGVGVAGYALTEDLSFLDALLNASMILTGMGPVNAMTNDGAKLFASFYAIYSGVAFLSIIGVFSAPVVHRFMHKLHLEE